MRTLLLLTGLALAGLTRAAAAAQTPAFGIVLDAGSGHTGALRTSGVLGDEGLEAALRSGLPVRLHFRVELWRDRFFDQLVDMMEWTVVLAHEPIDDRFLLHGTGAFTAEGEFDSYAGARAAVEREYPLLIRPPGPGRYYYSAVLEIETLSLSDFEELENWLRGELRPAVAGERSLVGAVGEGVKRAVIRILGMPARRYEARSERFESR